MKNFYVIVLGVAITSSVALPVHAASYGAWTIEDGFCDGVAARYQTNARTEPTTYAQCSWHGVNAQLAPPSGTTPYWTGWSIKSGIARWDTLSAVLDSQHSVSD